MRKKTKKLNSHLISQLMSLVKGTTSTGIGAGSRYLGCDLWGCSCVGLLFNIISNNLSGNSGHSLVMCSHCRCALSFANVASPVADHEYFRKICFEICGW